MRVLVTGAYGRCGTALIDHLDNDERYDLTYLNRSDRSDDDPYGGFDTHVADVADYEAMAPAFEGQDAVVHLAAYPGTGGSWREILESNIIGAYNALEAAREHEVESFVFASTNHVMGMYESEFAPELYEQTHDLLLDHTDPVRPDSFYGASKSFGEDLGRYYVENHDYPQQFYALRICTLNGPGYDHPYGDAEHAVEQDDVERGSAEYEAKVRRMKAMWQSRRDFAHQVACCLDDDTVDHGVYYGVSDNANRWFDIERARADIGYRPEDDGAAWDAPPE
ncbi:NAD(P)-dependent oxidoreductase (plasmid) [Halarchaeum sp. CBA1220]|uniref:NAD-dependent epimerase/dehydratase family protein n=1 Tax=Halarchaeum sp. CBA1220 TaxID=1853682 RepID=UPI000F3A9AB1|nr:NAD(P)-dependent oxidoreductase [Halarchaeum sp. CBA1220]QLC34737.1 NAD(P)-dependent oxidoreductase [Halarchaeum sp. CBA1220]